MWRQRGHCIVTPTVSISGCSKPRVRSVAMQLHLICHGMMAVQFRTVVHYDASILLDDDVHVLKTRSNHIEQYGARPDNYEITYIMNNQQPWAHISDKPCLVTYNPISRINEQKIIGKRWFQHIVHDIRHVSLLVPLFHLIQGKRQTWHCGAHTLINSQETCFISGLAAATQIGAVYPFNDSKAKRSFNY